MNRNNFKDARAIKLLGLIGLFVVAASLPVLARAQDLPLTAAPENRVQSEQGTGGAGYAAPDDVYVPPSSVERSEDAGLYAHTTYVLKARGNSSAPVPSVTIPGGETPASLECVYGIKGAYSSGCTKAVNGAETTSGWGTIALVDAFDNPNAASDYTAFSKEFGLPTTGFTKVYANGNHDCSTPAANAGWAVEESLDIEWAHAMAPAAKIILG